MKFVSLSATRLPQGQISATIESLGLKPLTPDREHPPKQADQKPAESKRTSLRASKPAESCGSSWKPFCLALLLLPFANGGQSIALAAWVAPLCFLRFARTHRPIVALPTIFVLQAAAFAIQFRGMIPLPRPVQLVVILVYATVFSIPYFGDRFTIERLSGLTASLVFPLLWTTVEFLISFGPFGSWCSVAYSQHGNLALLQLLAFTGIYGVTFLIAWAAAAANSFWQRPKGAPIPASTLICSAVLVVLLLIGGARLALFPPSSETVRIASLSKSELELHPDPAVAQRFARHETLTAVEIEKIRERARLISEDLLTRSEWEARAGARIVFWGEGNARVLKEDEAALLERGSELARKNGIYLGMALSSWHLETTPHLENKLVLIQPNGIPAWEFYKAHPVPGREATTSIPGDGRTRVLDTPYGRITPAICFDADFPRFLAGRGQSGADIVIIPSNDWQAIDPWHTWMAEFRAIEQGFNVVRQTSHGLSAAFDYQGRVLATMDHFRATDPTLVAQVPMQGTKTFYSIYGDLFGWLCCGGSLAIFSLPKCLWRRIRA